MTVSDFLTFFNGIYCDYDGAYGDQCFDLANNYSRWIGGPRFTGATADLIINQAGTFYTRIDNTPTGFPSKGDIVVWNWPHVGIATGDNTDKNAFDCLEQNDPENSACHLKHYSYSGVIGWLHPIALPTDQQTLIDQLRADRDKNWQLYQTQLQHTIDQETMIADKQKFIDALTVETQQDKAQIDQLTKDKQAYLDEYNQAQQDELKAKNDLSSCQTQLSVANGLLANRKDIMKYSKKELFTAWLNKVLNRG